MKSSTHLAGRFAAPLIAILSLVISSIPICAQENPADKPTAPFIEAGNSPLTITRTFQAAKSSDAAKAAPQPAPGGLTEVVKTVTEIHGPVQKVSTYRRGSSDPSEFWLLDGTLIGPHPREPSEVVVAGAAMEEGVGDFQQRFPDAAWVKAKNFSKWETIDGEKCRVHKDTLPRPGSENVVNPIFGEVTAWIAENSRRPLKITTADKSILFTYTAGPTQPILLPEKYAAFLKMLKLGGAGRGR